MALSTFWVSQNRKDLAERAIVAKREKDAAHNRRCIENDSYHKELAFKSSKYKNLEEGLTLRTPRGNEESRIKEKQLHAEKEKLERRRLKLAHLFAVENEQYMKELKTLQESERVKDPWNISRIKEQIEDLQRKRREAEQSMQKRYMHHLFNSNIPTPRERVDEQLQKEASESWQQRKEELEKLSLEKVEKEKEKCRALEFEQMKASQEAQDAEMCRIDEQQKLNLAMDEKVSKYNETDGELQKLKAVKQVLVQHLETLLSLRNRRQAVWDLQQKAFQKMQILWQSKEKLRRISVEVQHGLDFDMKLLATMSELNKSAPDGTDASLINLDCVADFKSKVEAQIALEKKKEMEIQLLYSEEASKQLEKRLKQWSSEGNNRTESMSEIFKILSNQIETKIQENSEAEKKLLERRESMLQEIEEFNAKSKSSIANLEEKKQFYLDRARRLREELETFSAPRPSSSRPSSSQPPNSRPPSSYGRSQLTLF